MRESFEQQNEKMHIPASEYFMRRTCNMKFLGMAVKAILALVAAIYFSASSGILYGLVMFGIIYGLISYYVWYFKKTGFSFSVWVGEKGLMMTLLSLALKILAPIIILAVITVTCNTIFPEGAGATIGGGIVIIICLVFVVLDVLTIINHFNPSVKVPFQNRDKNK